MLHEGRRRDALQAAHLDVARRQLLQLGKQVIGGIELAVTDRPRGGMQLLAL